MAETTEKKEVIDKEDDKAESSNVADYLEAPRKKRKTYGIIAVEDGFNRELSNGMANFIKSSYPTYAVSRPHHRDELARQFGRNIAILIISDEFGPLDDVMSLVRGLKERRRNESIPVIFLTRDGKRLIAEYHKYLLPYHEVDEYIQYPNVKDKVIYARIKNGIDFQNARKSRRYSISRSATTYHLKKDTRIPIRIIDMSAHGALIKAEIDFIFEVGDQLLLSIPTAEYMDLKRGDFLKISARARRVFISGDIAGISFEYVTDNQYEKIIRLLNSVVLKDAERKTGELKARSLREKKARL
ncbi:MAG: PilZ domain-containing protein [Oligoflexales bacterium]|nr:PilZ domain-containing protein [Oligoflexales bacterium]